MTRKQGDFRLPGENYNTYRHRVLDTVSDSFCAAKWLNATIWLGSGMTASCHHPDAHIIKVDDIKQNFKGLHNTKHKKDQRQLMLDGIRPAECEYCWKMEDTGRDSVSDRVFKSVIYSDDDIQEALKHGARDDINLKTLEIAFDRTCNFACSYCNPSFSTTWAKDIKANGFYQNLKSPDSFDFKQDGSWAQPFKVGETNPYIEAFWKWWPELSQSLQELRITGGEPLMSPDVWKLFDYFRENGSGDMVFAVNTNLGAKDELIDRLIECSSHVTHFDLYTSCEAYGSHAEYIRDGLIWDQFERNVNQVCSRANIENLNMMMTVNSLSLFSITKFMDWMLDLKAQYGRHFPVWSVNIMRAPAFMSVLALPDHIKNERREHITQWFKQAQDNPLMHDMEKASILRLVDYLETVDKARNHVPNKEMLWQDFRSFYVQYDIRRNKSFSDTFPDIIVEWMDNIEDENV